MFSNQVSELYGSGTTSVYERVLGDEFAALDPTLRAYFGPLPSGFEGVGSGRYSEAGLRARLLSPLFAVLGLRNIAFADHGTGVPFTVRNVVDAAGNLRAIRTFRFPRTTRTMTDVMRVADGRLVDRLGRRGEVEIELALRVSDGQLWMESGRLAVRVFGLRLPLPRIIAVTLQEQAHSDRTQHVALRIRAPLLGEIYGYAGTFTYELRPVS